MPTPFMCHECDTPTMNKDGICDNCVEPTTADEFNDELYCDNCYKEKHKYLLHKKNGKNICDSCIEFENYDKEIHKHALGVGFAQKDRKGIQNDPEC
jgi:predicted amidophosphoribosyltransferase